MWIPCSMLIVYFCISGVASAKDISDIHVKDSGLSDGKTLSNVSISKIEVPSTSVEHTKIALKSHAPDQQQQDFTNLTETEADASRNIPKALRKSPAIPHALGVKDDTGPMEGGRLPPPVEVVKSDLDSTGTLLDVEQPGVQTQDKSRNVSARKGAKIVPRKGVKESDSDELSGVTPVREKKIQYSTGSAYSAGPVSTSSLASTTVRNLQGQPSSEDRNEKNVLTVIATANNTTNKPSSPLSGSSVNTSAVSPTPHKKKSKPDLTFDKDDLPRDSEGRVLLDEVDEVDSGPATDYVVPVVLSMMAVPLLAIAGAFIYKKGRDFWERRHYRRMDFLIDVFVAWFL